MDYFIYQWDFHAGRIGISATPLSYQRWHDRKLRNRERIAKISRIVGSRSFWVRERSRENGTIPERTSDLRIERARFFSYKRRSRLRVLDSSRRQLWGLYTRNKLPIENEGTARMQREERDSGHPLFVHM